MKKFKEEKEKKIQLVRQLRNRGLGFHFGRVGGQRIQYFRLDEFKKVTEDSKDFLDQNEEMRQLLKDCKKQFINFKRPEHIKRVRFPSELEVAQSADPDKKFACFNFETTESRKLTMFAIILGVIFLFLFPVWPFALKYAVWLISLYLLIAIMFLIILRLLIYLVCAVMGFDMWIFPNLFAVPGFLDSFKPFYHAQRWEKNTFNLLFRLTIISLFLSYGSYLILYPETIAGTSQAIQKIYSFLGKSMGISMTGGFPN